MGGFNTTARPGAPPATIEAGTTPKEYNVSIPLANTEVAQVLSNNVKKLSIWCEGTAKIEYYYSSGSAVTLKIARGGLRVIDGLDFTGTIYLKASEGSQVVNIEEWT